jgi:hypothetical protein
MFKKFKHPMLKTFLFQASNAKTLDEFTAALNQIEGIHPDAVPWLRDHCDPRHWAEIYFPGNRYN